MSNESKLGEIPANYCTAGVKSVNTHVCTQMHVHFCACMICDVTLGCFLELGVAIIQCPN